MIYKIVIIGDPHFKTSNIKDCNDFINKIEQTTIEENPNLIIILGDVLHEHERLHTIPLNKSYEFIKRMSEISLTYILVGNHDLINNQQFLSTNHWMNALKDWPNVMIVDKPITHDMSENQFITMCPYVPNGRFIEALNTMLPEIPDSDPDFVPDSETRDWKDSILIFAHQEFKGCKMGAIESIDGDTWTTEYPPVISGHIHSNQTLKDSNVYYPGSAMQNAFGDPNNVIAIIDWDLDKLEESIETNKSNMLAGEQTSHDWKMYNLREIDLHLRKKKLVYIDIEDVEEYIIPETEDDIKLTINSTYEEFKIFRKSAKYLDITRAGIRIVHKNKKVKIKKDQTESSNPDTTDEIDETDNAEQEMITFAQNQGNFANIVEMLVSKEQNADLLSDFNYIFKDGAKDEDSFLL